jgi:hypothetical protein
MAKKIGEHGDNLNRTTLNSSTLPLGQAKKTCTDGINVWAYRVDDLVCAANGSSRRRQSCVRE